MNPPQFKKLLAALNAARDEAAREDAIDDLCWIFYSGNWEVAEGEPILQMLVNMIEHESNKRVRNLILEAIENAYGLPDAWKRKEIHLDLDPLACFLNTLKETHSTGYIAQALYVLGESGQSKYRDACAAYLDHSNESVREAAKFAVERLTQNAPGES
jgi:hypothetical protein